MKKILVLSDIHIPTKLKEFPYKEISPYANKVDYVFGLGDYTSDNGYQNLFFFNKEIYAVSGNMDDYSIKMQLPYKLNLRIENIDIGLIHGWGGHFDLRKKIIKEFESVDLICYGHTHSYFFDTDMGVQFLNPGSLCGENPSFAILTINNKKISANIVDL